MLQATLIIPVNDIRFGQTRIRELKRIKLKTAVTADLLAGNYPLHSQLGVGLLRLCCPSLFCIKGTKVELGAGGGVHRCSPSERNTAWGHAGRCGSESERSFSLCQWNETCSPPSVLVPENINNNKQLRCRQHPTGTSRQQEPADSRKESVEMIPSMKIWTSFDWLAEIWTGHE